MGAAQGILSETLRPASPAIYSLQIDDYHRPVWIKADGAHQFAVFDRRKALVAEIKRRLSSMKWRGLPLPGRNWRLPGGLRQAAHQLHIELDAVEQPNTTFFAELGFVPATDPGILGAFAVFLGNLGELP